MTEEKTKEKKSLSKRMKSRREIGWVLMCYSLFVSAIILGMAIGSTTLLDMVDPDNVVDRMADVEDTEYILSYEDITAKMDSYWLYLLIALLFFAIAGLAYYLILSKEDIEKLDKAEKNQKTLDKLRERFKSDKEFEYALSKIEDKLKEDAEKDK